ncbi:hypothetical protein LTR78_003068 [Recurvomyces mirabilis]|uniref:Uncharacterized protein n=1 Tax=Recurvomyces mirabilis TaxID=574656 RepID=A0AAE1C3W2_9PEZI|nr:hypothetical protein LTR78_003068 [Recurvomyces mirabilis]KAK5157110.1 hypothetical protein LTS14_004628 [Recurvomyces mirabilis]
MHGDDGVVHLYDDEADTEDVGESDELARWQGEAESMQRLPGLGNDFSGASSEEETQDKLLSSGADSGSATSSDPMNFVRML